MFGPIGYRRQYLFKYFFQNTSHLDQLVDFQLHGGFKAKRAWPNEWSPDRFKQRDFLVIICPLSTTPGPGEEIT